MAMRIEDLDGIDDSDIADGSDLMSPVTPGEILRDDVMEPFGLSAGMRSNSRRWFVASVLPRCAASALCLYCGFEPMACFGPRGLLPERRVIPRSPYARPKPHHPRPIYLSRKTLRPAHALAGGSHPRPRGCRYGAG